jgi:hypothetical protein
MEFVYCHVVHSSSNIWVIKLRRDGRSTWQVWGTEEVHTGFRWGYMMEKDHLKDLGVEGRILFKLILQKWDGEAGVGLTRLRINISGGLLCIR